MLTHVVLFRTPSSSDTYETVISNLSSSVRTYLPVSIPVLAETIDVDALGPVVQGGAGRWGGVIMTSRRAAEAWVQAVKLVQSASLISIQASEYVDWSETSLFSPGEATRSVLSSLPFSYVPSQTHAPASSASSLAPLILAHPSTRPYLFLTGDKTLRDLPDTLSSAGREVVELKVYATRPREDLEKAVQGISRAIGLEKGVEDNEESEGRAEREGGSRSRSADTVWMVFFSPSSAQAVVGTTLGGLIGGEDGRVRVAAIGETTATWLRMNKVRVDATAQTPSAEGVGAAIQAADSQGRGL